MSGMEPILVGAALGGGVSAARGGNPLTGALLGGITGGIGSSILGAASKAAATGATASTGLNATLPTAVAGNASTYGIGSAVGGTTGLTAPAMTGYGLTPAASGLSAGQAALEAPTAFSGLGVAPATVAPTFMQTAKAIPGAMIDYAKQNPIQSLMVANSLLSEPPPAQAPQGTLARGTPMQMAQDQQYSYAAPKISLI